MAQKQILIICGEASGDLNAANLVREILKINPEIKISGVGGVLLAEAGCKVFYEIRGLAVIGVFSVLKQLPKFLALKKLILEKIRQEKPDAIILVDFSGFNLRLAKAINLAIPVIYYISPQVWASRRGRIKTIKKYISKMIVLFKFEEEFYRRNGVRVNFVGSPLLDIVRPTMEKNAFLRQLNLFESKTTLTLLPGSRKEEVKNILPVMLKTAQLIYQNKVDTQFVVAKSAQVDWDTYDQITHAFSLDLKVVEGKTYDCLAAADFVLVASGTATLETAILEKPFVIIYKMNLLNYLLYRPQVRLPFIGMVNIVAEKKIIPEFIQFGASPKKIADSVLKILREPGRIEQIKDELVQIKPLLGEKGATQRAAEIILDSFQGHPSS